MQNEPFVPGGGVDRTWAPVLWSVLLGATLLAQGVDPDSEALRKLVKVAPVLAFTRVEINASPPLTFEGISAVSSDKEGNLYVLHRPADGDPVVVLDRAGRVLRSWGKGMFRIPHGLRVDPAGYVWTVDANTSMVYKFTPEGQKVLEISIGDVPDRTQDFCGATDVAFAQDGHVLVADGYCNARVIEYDATGSKVRQWGRPGTGPGEFNVVHALAIGPRGHLYVADRENGRVQWFDKVGTFLGQWRFGGQLYSIAFSPAGEMYVGTHPKGVPLGTEFNVVKVDRVDGSMLGRVEARAHELAIMSNGTLLPATRGAELLLLRAQ